MNFLKQAAERAKHWYAALTPRARLAAAAMVVAVLAGLLWLARGGFGEGDTLLLGGRSFDAAEITAAQAAFSKAKLTEARIEGDRIRVPAEKESAYVAAMADGGALPADFHDYLDETLSDLGPFVSGKQRDELIKNAKQRELANILRRLPGIQAAAVHYDRQRELGLNRKETITASVIVWPDASEPLDPRRLETIRKLVASSIAGLKPADVAVTDANGGELSADNALDSAQNRYLAAMRMHEQRIREQVLGVLGHISGLRLAINVELEPANETTPKSTTARGQKPAESSPQAIVVPAESDVLLPPDNGTPDPPANAPRQAGIAPRRVTVAAAIPRSHFAAIWHSRHGGRGDESPPAAELAEVESAEIATYEELVRLAIPAGDDSQAARLVKIAAYDQLDPTLPDEPALASQPLAWLARHWTTLGMIAAATVCVVMFGLMIKAGRTKRQPPGDETLLDFSSDPLGRTQAEIGVSGPALAGHTVVSSRMEDELHDMIRKDPEAAASVLKLWMADSA